MSDMEVSDEMLMAYADGELDEPERSRIAEMAARDPSVAARIAGFAASAQAVHGALGAVHAEPVPPEMIANVLRGQESKPRQDNALWRRAAVPIAASLAIAVIAAGYFAGLLQEQPSGPEGFVQAVAGAPVLSALARTPSGETVTVRSEGIEIAATAMGTYPIDGGLCRIFDATGPLPEAFAARALTCTDGDSWSVPVATVTGGATYRPASANPEAAIDDYLDAAGAGADIGRQAEAELIARGWSTTP